MRKRLATFTGTPTQFLAQARVFAEEYPHLLFIALNGRVYVRSEDWTPLVTVGADRPGASALITPRELPNGQCNLLLSDLVGDGAKLEKQVDLFLDWLHQAGWIAVMDLAPLIQKLVSIRADEAAWRQAAIQTVRRLVDGDQPAAAQPEIDGRPEPEAAKTVKKHEPLKCNQWLCRKYFDEGQTNYQELVREWLHIRQTQDYKAAPVNPMASMRTAVNEEKERRRRNQT